MRKEEIFYLFVYGSSDPVSKPLNIVANLILWRSLFSYAGSEDPAELIQKILKYLLRLRASVYYRPVPSAHVGILPC